VGFEKPWRFVERPGKAGQYVGGIGITGLACLSIPAPNRIRDTAIALSQRREMVGNFIDIHPIGLEPGFVCHSLTRAQRCST
jgi:hypothetical protein